MGYCGTCEYLTSRHICKKYNKRLTHSSYDGKGLAYSVHERCRECEKDYYIKDLERRVNRLSALCPIRDGCKESCILCEKDFLSFQCKDSVLFGNHFLYLSSNRIGPRPRYHILDNLDFVKRDFWKSGELAVQYLERFGNIDVKSQ